jgi:putative nucleotidyltransferase with HDIG domain
VLDVLHILREASHEAYVVGGGLRDLLLGRSVSDWDVSSGATPDEVIGLFERTVPIGAEHGTVTVVTEGGHVEVTAFRREGPYSDSRRPDSVSFIGNVEEDLSRRDFTINAMAYDPLEDRLVDPFDGRADLEGAIIRAVGDPLERFSEDALRPLRAIRLAAILGFEIDVETFRAIAATNDKVSLVAPERIRDELKKILKAEKPSVAFELMRETSLLEHVLPELEESFGVPQNRHHAYDVYYHSLMTCDAARVEKPLVRLAALLHDVGKPVTKEEIRGDATFYNHQIVGAQMADIALRRLKFSRAEREQVVNLIRHHMFNYTSEWSDAALRRFVRKVGEDSLADLFDLRIADRLGNGLKQGFPVNVEEMRLRVESILRESHALKVSDLEVSGADVTRELGVRPGPVVGKVLNQLLEAVLEDPSLNSRETLLAMIRESKCRDE